MKEINDELFDDSTGVSLRYDALIPDAERDLPAVVCIHGGGWISGDKSDMHEVARSFAGRGFAAFCPQYRLAPLHTYPAAVEDCARFVKFLRNNAYRLGICPSKVGSFGNSAGGYLSTMLAVSEDAQTRVDAAVDVCGLADLTNPGEHHPPIAWDFIAQYIGEPYQGNEDLWIQASPLFRVRNDTAPLLIVHGAVDDVVYPAQSERLFHALQDHGVPAELIILPNEGHSFSYEAFMLILDKSEAFFKEHFSK